MSNAEMVKYLDLLSDEIADIYAISKEHSDELVSRSPMRKLLQNDAEYVTHMPMSSWAELIYEAAN